MITTLEQLYFDQIRDLYHAENQLLTMLPQLAAHASNDKLREAFTDRLAETREHCLRLEEISHRHGISDKTVACEAMRGLMAETRKHLTETVPGEVRDAVLIASGNRIEHYEIAGYGVARAFAECLGFDGDADLLQESLDEVGNSDAIITKLATGGIFTSGINQAASMVNVEPSLT